MNGDLASLRRFRLEIPLLAIVIVAIGIAYIQSASFDVRAGIYKPYTSSQLKWLAISLGGFVAALAVPYQTIERYTWFLYAGILPLLLGLHLIGQEINGARSWYKLSESAKLQPSELSKIVLICAVAKVLMYRKDMATVRPWLAVAAVAGPPLLSILREPDLGTVLVFGPALLAMLFVAGCNWKHLAALFASGAAAGTAAFAFALEDYQRKRILVFLNPELDPDRAGYQTLQSRIAIGSGGLLGQGYGEGPQTQRDALPENHTDFIFSVVGEEGGFVVAALLLLLLLALLLVCLDVAWRTREPFGRLVCVGIAALYAGQMFVNCGMTMGLCPVTGITLPFVSYGGSSLLTCFMALGLVANVAMRPVPTLADDFRRR